MATINVATISGVHCICTVEVYILFPGGNYQAQHSVGLNSPRLQAINLSNYFISFR